MRRLLSISAGIFGSTLMLAACNGPAANKDEVQQGSSLASINVSLPEKSALPEGTALLLTHYRFQVKAIDNGPYAAPRSCTSADQQGEYTTAIKLEAKLKRTCDYEVSLILGKQIGSEKLTMPEDTVMTIVDGSKSPQTAETNVLYFGRSSVTTSEMAKKDSVDVTISLQRQPNGDDDMNLPDDISVGKDVDMNVKVTFEQPSPAAI